MPATRTQVYLTSEQREKMDAVMQREHVTLAHVVRSALDDYLAKHQPSVSEALDRTFGALPDLTVPSRDEWDRDRRPR